MFKILGQSASSYMASVIRGPFGFGNGWVGGGPVPEAEFVIGVGGLLIFVEFGGDSGFDSFLGLPSFALLSVYAPSLSLTAFSSPQCLSSVLLELSAYCPTFNRTVDLESL